MMHACRVADRAAVICPRGVRELCVCKVVVLIDAVVC